MRRLLCLVFGFLGLAAALPAFAGGKSSAAPEEIVGVGLDHTRVKEALSGKTVDCSDASSKDTRICKVLPYEYLGGELSPDGSPWGKVDAPTLVLETVGKKDLILSAGVNWSVKGQSDEPLRARFKYLSAKLEKTFGEPTSTTPPSLGPTPTFTDGLEEYRQFSNGNVSAVLVLRKRGEGEKRKVSVSVTFTDQTAYRQATTTPTTP
jgi:hypothetical protein